MTLTAFLSAYRQQFPQPMSDLQIAGLTRLFAALAADTTMHDIRWQAYLLATAKHETARTFQPIRERGGDNYLMSQYWLKRTVRQSLGNVFPSDAVRYCGRGYVQITGRRNYAVFTGLLGIDLLDNPDLALEHEHAYQIASIGLRHGKFTGKALSHYLNAHQTDFFNARRVVNGMDRAREIADDASTILTCLQDAA